MGRTCAWSSPAGDGTGRDARRQSLRCSLRANRTQPRSRSRPGCFLTSIPSNTKAIWTTCRPWVSRRITSGGRASGRSANSDPGPKGGHFPACGVGGGPLLPLPVYRDALRLEWLDSQSKDALPSLRRSTLRRAFRRARAVSPAASGIAARRRRHPTPARRIPCFCRRPTWRAGPTASGSPGPLPPAHKAPTGRHFSRWP